MLTNEERLKGLSSIYRYIFSKGETHRNILRKDLIWMGKVGSKSKFFKVLDGLLSSGNLTMDKEIVSLNPKVIGLGVLVKKRDDFYVVTPGDRKYYKINKKVVNGYKNGEILDFIIENADRKAMRVTGSTNKDLMNSIYNKARKENTDKLISEKQDIIKEQEEQSSSEKERS